MDVIDYIVLFVYFAGMAGIGFWAMRRIKGQEDYFMGGRKFGKLFQTFAAFGAGTGSEFSVLPAQNATGNWVKVTQRVPVKIRITSKSPRRLIAGLSAEVTVFTDDR